MYFFPDEVSFIHFVGKIVEQTFAVLLDVLSVRTVSFL